MIPEGFVLVPRKWTAEMLQAARQAPQRMVLRSSLTDIQNDKLEEEWEAALRASPLPPDGPPRRRNVKLGTVSISSHGRATLDAKLRPEDLPPGDYSIEAVHQADV